MDLFLKNSVNDDTKPIQDFLSSGDESSKDLGFVVGQHSVGKRTFVRSLVDAWYEENRSYDLSTHSHSVLVIHTERDPQNEVPPSSDLIRLLNRRWCITVGIRFSPSIKEDINTVLEIIRLRQAQTQTLGFLTRPFLVVVEDTYIFERESDFLTKLVRTLPSVGCRVVFLIDRLSDVSDELILRSQFSVILRCDPADVDCLNGKFPHLRKLNLNLAQLTTGTGVFASPSGTKEFTFRRPEPGPLGLNAGAEAQW